MLESIASFFNFIYELIFGKKKKSIYDREYRQYQRDHASSPYYETEFGGEVNDDYDDDYYNLGYYNYDHTPAFGHHRKKHSHRRKIRRKILKKPPFVRKEKEE
uniref:Immunogenic miracidial antigen 8I' n=1 Tax=Parastrongyloides trichosuri TaxID=131310 RepID=A0A0N4ZDK8_PARTI